MEKYFFPNEGITIEADNIEEAVKILNSNKKEDVPNDKKHVSKKK